MRNVTVVLIVAALSWQSDVHGQTSALGASRPAQKHVGALSRSQAVCHILRVEKAPDLGAADPLADPAWDRADALDRFAAGGVPEPAERATQVRMLCTQDHLFLAARCLDPQPEKIKTGTDPSAIWTDDSIEMILTERPDRSFPFVHIQANAAGVCSAVRMLYPFTKSSGSGRFDTRPVQVLDPRLLQVRAGRNGQGWWIVLAMPRKDLNLSASGFRGNVVRNRPADGSDFAWIDMWSGWFQSDTTWSSFVFADQVPPSPPRLATPAALAVGWNRLRLEDWREGWQLLCNSEPVAVGADGRAVLQVERRGLVNLQIVDRDNRPAATYNADVPRPLLIEAQAPFQVEQDRPIEMTVSLNVAQPSPVDVLVEVVQDGRVVGSRGFELANGTHRVSLPFQTDRPGEVELRASAALSDDSGRTIALAALHRCVIGLPREAFDRFRPGIESLDTQACYRAAVADACNYYRLVQAGDGQYRSFGRGGDVLRTDDDNGQMTYAFALAYTADWPENPYRGDPRFLAAASAGLEAGLAAETWRASRNHPPNRQLQSYLLAYELLKDKVSAEQASFWRDRLTILMEDTVRLWMRPAMYKLSFYSVDVGTGSNHFAYHTANVYTAGRVLNRPDWSDMSAKLMRDFAVHGRDGFFPERRGIPATHYNWLSATALAEYFAQSGDRQVLPTLLRVSDFFCHTLLPPGNTMVILHDGRNNEARASGLAEPVLSLTPSGRWFARARASQRIGNDRRPSQTPPASWFRTAEAAVSFQSGEMQEPADEFEYAFLDGRALIARRTGFIYGLSAICIPPTTVMYEVDPQNALELNHVTLGPILSGANSQQQPEAGSFCRRRGDRTEFLPVKGRVERTDAGHAAVLGFDSFQTRLSCEVLSASEVRVTVDLLTAEGDEPVLFNFFPVADGAATLKAGADVTAVELQDVVIRCSQPVQLQRDFRIVDPYSQAYRVPSKPLRAFTVLRHGQSFVIDVTVRGSAAGRPTEGSDPGR